MPASPPRFPIVPSADAGAAVPRAPAGTVATNDTNRGPAINPRRSDYDVTNTVQVSSPDAVRLAVAQLFSETWPRAPFDAVERSFARLVDLFSGRDAAWVGVDTLYHDLQHTLDITLALARLMAGYERQASPDERLGGERAAFGIVVALFHDAGYLRGREETDAVNGAEFTRTHVSRGARHLVQWLPVVGLADWVPVAIELIHYTGYEKPITKISLGDPRDHALGRLLGTADFTAQMADRCYLEKCRDRLYPEFVLGGVALPTSAEGYRRVIYASGIDLLRQTPEFMQQVRRKRLDGEFGAAYRYYEILFGGRNPYIEAIERNLTYLRQVLRNENWKMLRRNPPVFTAVPDPVGSVRGLTAGYVRRAWA
jgi:hypothetical protein